MYMAPYVLGAARWLLEQAGGKIFTTVTDRLAVKMGFKSEQLTTSQAKVLLDDYLQNLEGRLAQRVIARLDEERLIILKSAIDQLKKSSKTKLREAVLNNALNGFSHIINLPEQGDTGGFSNAQLRSVAFLGIAAIHMALQDSDVLIAENVAAAIYADSSTAERWFGKELVQGLLKQNPISTSISSQPTRVKPLLLPTTIVAKTYLTQGTVLWTYHNTSKLSPRKITWSSERNRVSVYGGHGVRVLDAMTGNLLVSQDAYLSSESVSWHESIYAHWWSSDLSFFAHSGNSKLSFVDSASGKKLKEIPESSFSVDYVAPGQWSPNGKYVAFARKYDHIIDVWDTSRLERVLTYDAHLLKHQGRFIKKKPNQIPMSISEIVWSPDGTRIASLETFFLTEDDKHKEAIHVWEALTGKTIAIIECPIWSWGASPGEFPTIDWLSNNKQLAYLRGSTVQVLDAANGKLVLSHLFSHTLDYMKLRCSPSGKSLALISKDGKVVSIWNIANNTPMSFTIPQTLVKIAWSPDEKHIISCSQEPHSVHIWNIASRQNIYTYSGHSDFIRIGIWSPDGGQVLSADDKEIILWQAF